MKDEEFNDLVQQLTETTEIGALKPALESVHARVADNSLEEIISENLRILAEKADALKRQRIEQAEKFIALIPVPKAHTTLVQLLNDHQEEVGEALLAGTIGNPEAFAKQLVETESTKNLQTRLRQININADTKVDDEKLSASEIPDEILRENKIHSKIPPTSKHKIGMEDALQVNDLKKADEVFELAKEFKTNYTALGKTDESIPKQALADEVVNEMHANLNLQKKLAERSELKSVINDELAKLKNKPKTKRGLVKKLSDSNAPVFTAVTNVTMEKNNARPWHWYD